VQPPRLTKAILKVVTMQNIRFMKVTKGDLIWLFHTSEQTVDKWAKSGLRVDLDGKYLLSDAIAWLKNQHRIELRNKLLSSSLSQQELVNLFGVSRQSITEWGRVGLPKNRKGSYNLQQVCRWLVNRYPQLLEKNYQQKLTVLERKLSRNFSQSLRFISREK
jgi:phage terminase Nu1 subunit (DNA packaging protein)